MKKYIVLSVNDNPEYLFYLPLTVWAWRKLGWEPIVFKAGSFSRNPIYDLAIINIPNGPCLFYCLKQDIGYPSEMVAQISRLYSACCREIGYFMTGDIDMIPLSDYWKFDENEITTWGRDLSDEHFPICYIGMDNAKWQHVMQITSNLYSEMIQRDLDSMPNAKDLDPSKRWVVDQDLITEKLKETSYPITMINRGTYKNGYPIGRVDRSAWILEHEQLIDCHMLRGIWKNEEHKRMTMELLHKVWPDENFTWFENYIEEFKKQVNG